MNHARSAVNLNLFGWVTTALLLFAGGCGLFLDDEALLQRAQKSYASGDTRAALIDLKDLLQRTPGSIEGRVALGEVSLAMGDVEAAIRELELARQQGERSDRAVELLARAYVAARRSPDALKLLDSAPADVAALLVVRGTALLDMARAEEAEAAFTRAAEIDPNSVDASLGLSSAVALTRGVPAALAITDQSLQLDADSPRVYQARGMLRAQLREFPAAIEEYQQAVALASKQSNQGELLASLAGLADTQLTNGDAAGGLVTTTRMQQLAPENIVSRYLHARALFVNGEIDAARPLLEQNLTADPNHSISKLLLGAITLTKGNFGQAEMYLASVVAAEPRNAQARQLLAEARLRQQKSADAVETLLPMLDEPGVSAQLLALAGRASLAAGATASGLDYLQRSTKAQPDNPALQLELIAGYIATGDLEQARALLESMPDSDSGAQNFRRTYLLVVTHLADGERQAAIDTALQAAKATPDEIPMQVLAGTILMETGRVEQARGYFERVLALAPNSPQPLVNLGRVEMMQNQVESARRHFEAALKLQPGHPGASLALAFLELGANRSQQALKLLVAARQANPQFVEGRALEVRVLLQAGDFKQAEQLARDMLRDIPGSAASYTTLARVQAAAGRMDDSIATLKDAVERQPKAVGPRFDLARTLAVAGRNDAARDAAKQTLELSPRHLPSIELLARLAIKRGDWVEAGQRAEDLKKFAPEQASTHVLSGDVNFERKNFAAAAAAYRQAGTLVRDAGVAAREFQARRAGKLAEPMAPLEKLVAEQPKDLRALLTLADAQQVLKQREPAARTYRQVLQLEPQNTLALNNLAWLLYERGDRSAVDLARRAHEAAPDRAEITDTYAWILVEHGEVDQGLQLLAKIADANAAPEIRLHYALALARGGKNDEATRLARDLVNSPVASVSGRARELLVNLEGG